MRAGGNIAVGVFLDQGMMDQWLLSQGTKTKILQMAGENKHRFVRT